MSVARFSAILPVTRGQRAIAVVIVTLAVAGTMGIAESAYRVAVESLATVRDRQLTRFEVTSVLRHLNAAEAAQRGYLLVGRPEYLKPMHERRHSVEEKMANLRKRYADTSWADHLQELDTSIREKYAELDETIRLYDLGSHSAWQALMETDIGREKMDAVRAAGDALIRYESERIVVDRHAIHRTLQMGRFGVHTLALLSLLGVIVFLRRNAQMMDNERRHALELQAERDHLDAAVVERTQQLTDLASHLQTVREDERAHLARELHDELGALLTAAKLDLARLRRSLRHNPQPEMSERLDHLGKVIDQGIELKRMIIEDLRPSALSNLGLVPALEILVRDFAERSGLKAELELNEAGFPQDAERSLTLYRFVQEALTNVAKYAKAEHLVVRLQCEADGGCHAEVQDDGIGFDALTQNVGRHGLVGMRYRVQAHGGDLEVVSEPGRGTRLRVQLPPHRPAPAAPAADHQLAV